MIQNADWPTTSEGCSMLRGHSFDIEVAGLRSGFAVRMWAAKMIQHVLFPAGGV